MRNFICCLLLGPLCVWAQGKPSYPQDYFHNPLEIPILLAGNFGECRPGHFHSGLDIKTKGEENQPVHVAADGYISRIKMDKGGFGHALYVVHPNGYTTLYAHLNDFAPALQKYLKEEQYKKKRWDVDLPLTPSQFPVKQGDLIAWSGNTGGSSAPHLHFEIRDTKTEHPLNPQLFGLHVIDNIAPVFSEVALYYFNGSSGFYQNTKLAVSLEKKGSEYKPTAAAVSFGKPEIVGDTVIVPRGSVRVGINITDYMDSSDNTITFYTAELFADDNLQAQVTLDNIGYEETRYMNAYIDYTIRQTERKWVQCLFKLPGNHLDGIYTYMKDKDGWLKIEDGKAHKIKIIVTDNNGNRAVSSFYLRAGEHSAYLSDGPQMAGGGVFFEPGKTGTFNNGAVAFELDGRQMYDAFYFRVIREDKGDGYSKKLQLADPGIPLHHYFDLKIKPDKEIPVRLKDKIVVMYSDGKDEDGRAALVADSGWYKAKVRNFGTYWLDIDTVAPVMASMQRKGAKMTNAKKIVFTVKDDKTSVKAFSGYLDNKWICFEQHGDDFFYRFDEHCPRGKHKLSFKAEDENGNVSIYELNFTR